MRTLIYLLIISLFTTTVSANSGRANAFDYYVLALSWSPNWCALEGDARRSPQCNNLRDHGWTLHGLWPQFHRGWPTYCQTKQRNPPRDLTESMSDIMGTSGLAWYQWKKHGRCSGLSANSYFDLARRAYNNVTRPESFRQLVTTVKLPASIVEQAFLQANPAIESNMLTVTCRNGHIQEVRICLSKELSPIHCGTDTIRDCTLRDALFNPIR
ncbi:ribonuclease T2 family protein [Pseudopelagicola sp. nBUS_20]|uniref:ribonuclease T2 family protein n=1 Tax=Pseudopelagicola sp. nBUS_20 TaxID=3395317 RepID=UPI003EBBAA39